MQEPDFRARLVLKATISPSEDPAKVEQALTNLVGSNFTSEMSRSKVRLASEDLRALTRIRDQLRDRHVRSAARRQMLLNTSGRSTSLMFNRQAAAAGVVALCGSEQESPLGPIYLEIESGTLDKVIDWLTAYAG